MIRKEYTKQENIIAEILSQMGLRFYQQASVGPYQVDFLLDESNIVIEADGVYGHSKRADNKRNTVLEKMGMEVYHIKEIEKAQIEEKLGDIFCQD